MTHVRSPLSSWIGLVFVFGLYLGMSGLVSQRLSENDASFVLPYRAPEAHWPAPLLKAITFGHWPVLVDSLWIGVLTDPSVDKIAKGERSPMFYDLLTASELDPGFFDLHYFGSNLLSVIRGDQEGALILLKRAYEFQYHGRLELGDHYIDNFWRAPHGIALTLGYLYLYEFDNFSEAERVLRETSKFPGTPPYLARLANGLKDPAQVIEIGIRITQNLLKRDLSDKARKKLEERLNFLHVSSFILQVNSDWARYLKNHPKGQLHAFLQEKGFKSRDPWGGELYLNKKNNIETQTPMQKVLGL